MTAKLHQTRRAFLDCLLKAGAGAVALAGGVVGFTPSGVAAATCDFAYTPLSGCQCHSGLKSCSCIGMCSTRVSSCRYGPRYSVDFCLLNCPFPPCPPSRVVGFCKIGGSGYCCGRWC